MTTLAAVLVKQRAAPLETVEQAMLRQSLFGGDLATNLLELRSIEERALLDALAVALDCPALDPGPIGEVPMSLREAVASSLLSEYACIPLGLEGNAVVLAAASQLPESLSHELTQRYGRPLTLRASLEIRIRQALARSFGLPLDVRTEKLLDQLDGHLNESAAPPLHDGPAPSSQVPTPRISVSVAARASSIPTKRSLAHEERHRIRGTMTAATAEAKLSQATNPGEITDIWIEFASQYFDYTALFAIQGDIAVGRQARGSGTTGDAFLHIGVPLDLPSVLDRVRRSGQWLLTALEPRGLDRSLARDLGRDPGPQALLLPIAVRDRVVLVTYGDEGRNDVELEHVGDVLALRPLVELHLERLVVERKRGRSLRPSNVKPVTTPPYTASALEHKDSATVSYVETTRSTIIEPVSDITQATTCATDHRQFPHEEITVPIHATPDAQPPNTDTSETDEPNGSDLSVTVGLVQPVLSVGDSSLSQNARIPENPPEALPPTSLPPSLSWPQHETRPGITAKLELITEDESEESNPPTVLPVDTPVLPTGFVDIQSPPLHEDQDESIGNTTPTHLREHEQSCVEFVEQLSYGDVTALDSLLELGDTAISVLVRKMPGPITSPSRGPRTDPLVKASDCGPILRALVAFGPAARPYVIARATDKDPKVRAWAVRLLGELGGQPAAHVVSERLVLERDAEVKRAAHQASQLLYRDPESAQSLRRALLNVAIDRQAVIKQRLAAIDAITDLRDVQAIPTLIELLGDPNPGTAAGAGQALVVLARQDFGYDQKRWNEWWMSNTSRERIEWVIDALDHRQSAIRQAAAEELRLMSRLYVGDYDDESSEARAKVQQKYRTWWSSGGRESMRPPRT